MATSKAKPTDATGRQREKLQAQYAEQQQEAAAQMAMASVQKQVALETEIIDATKDMTETHIHHFINDQDPNISRIVNRFIIYGIGNSFQEWLLKSNYSLH